MTVAEVAVADIVAHPDEHHLKLMYADWLDEQGEVKLAAAYRWCGKYGRHPQWYDIYREWSYFNKNHPNNTAMQNACYLPEWLFLRMKTNKDAGKHGDLNYSTYEEAMMAIADHLDPIEE